MPSRRKHQFFDGDHMISVMQECPIEQQTVLIMKKSKIRTGQSISIGARVRQARKAKGLTQEALAKAVNLRQSAIAEVEADRVTRPKKLFEMAQALGTTEEWLLGKVADSKAPIKTLGAIYAEVIQIPVEGVIESGVLRAVDAFDDVLPPAQVTVARDPRFPDARMVAFLNNDRLDLANINPGDMVIGVDFEQAELPLRERMLVIAQVTRDGGLSVERSLRKVATFRDRIELLPQGTGRVHKTIVIGPNYDQAGRARSVDGADVRILAIVLRVQKEIPI